ncbi:MAG: ATP-binding protein [Actinomycetota bacterium]
MPVRDLRLSPYVLAAAALGAVLYFALPQASLAQGLVFQAFPLGAFVAIVVQIRRGRIRFRAAWIGIASGLGLFGLGDLYWGVQQSVFGSVPAVSGADAIYLVGYVVFGYGLVRLGSEISGGDRLIDANLIDALVIGVAASLVIWVTVLGARVDDGDIALLERAVSVGYPLLDMALVGLFVRMRLNTPGRPAPWLMLLMTGLAVQLVSDVGYGVLTIEDRYHPGSIVNAGFLLAYVLTPLAAAHPSACEPLPDARSSTVSMRETVIRFLVLAAALATLPGVLAFCELPRFGVDLGAITVAAALLPTLVLVRLWLIFRAYRDARNDALQARNFSESVVESSIDGVGTFDRELRYVSWNAAAERLTGIDRTDAIGRVLPLLHDFREDALFVEYARRALNGEISQMIRREVTLEDGLKRVFDVRLTPLRDRLSEVTGGIVLIRDVTEHHELQERYSQSQKLEAIGQLAGGVAHDFHNLLTAIGGYTEFVIADLDPGSAAAQDLRNVTEAVGRAKSLTSQLLAFGRKQRFESVDLDVNELTTSTVQLLQRLIGERIRVQLDTGPGPLVVHADPGQLSQVLINLAVNARDAMPEGGSIRISTEGVSVDRDAPSHEDAAPGEYVRILVADDGTGMDAETVRRIFEPFFTTKKSGEGTGLGLAMVHGIVHQSGGRIAVTSAPGEGTTFTIHLPRRDAIEPEAVDRPVVERRHGTRVLLAEDDDAVREVLVRLLTSFGYTVTAAADAEQAEELALDTAYDFVVTDVLMPGRRGDELVHRLRLHRPALRALYVSGYHGSQLVDLVAGDRMLLKPFSTQALEEAVAAVASAA